MAPVARVCVLGLDAADPALVEGWCAEGVLPTLDRLRRLGTWIGLRDAGLVPSAAVWPTLSTGVHAGHHGVVHPVGLVPGTLALRPVVFDDGLQPPIWSRLATAGARPVVVDVPFAPLDPHLGGVQILDWAAYERPGPPRARPEAALADVVRRAGPYPVARDLSRDPAMTERELWRDHAGLLAGAAAKGRALQHLLSTEPWDFFMATFTEAHAAGHHFWHLEGSRGRRPPGAPARPVRDVYQAIDRELARLVDALDLTRTLLVVTAGHGMGPNVAGCHLVDPLLRALGLQAPPARSGRELLGRLRAACPRAVRQAVSRRLPHGVRTAVTGYWMAGGLDGASRAFGLPSDQLGLVRINLAGREPGGVVRPGAEYEALCERLADAFRRLVDAETGTPVVRDVGLADRLFPGPARDRLPDLLVSWHDDRPFGAVRTREGAVVAAASSDGRSGNHRPDGFAIVCGPGVRPGATAVGHLLDLAPTVMRGFGLEPAPSMPGRSWLASPGAVVRGPEGLDGPRPGRVETGGAAEEHRWPAR
jgi:predicted AlkP superfamily phosphohydrolase/phosphomutase